MKIQNIINSLILILLIGLFIITIKQRIQIQKIEIYIELDKKWFDSIHNPINQPFLLEMSIKLDIPIDSVTQKQFYDRYLKHE